MRSSGGNCCCASREGSPTSSADCRVSPSIGRLATSLPPWPASVAERTHLPIDVALPSHGLLALTVPHHRGFQSDQNRRNVIEHGGLADQFENLVEVMKLLARERFDGDIIHRLNQLPDARVIPSN